MSATEVMDRLDAWVAEHEKLARTAAIELSFVFNARWTEAEAYSEHGLYRERQGIFAVLQLVAYDRGTPELSIRDIKQQPVLVGPVDALADPDRLIAFLDGWARILPWFVDSGSMGEIDTLMPHDFFLYKVLALKKPRTADDFAAACARRWKLS